MLEGEETQLSSSAEDMFTRQQLGVPSGQTTLLSLSRDRERDVIKIEIPSGKAKPTKRGILGKITKIYDPLRLISPVRSLVNYQEPIEDIDLQTFGDASGQGVAATVVAVMRQSSGISKGLVASKFQLAKKNLTIPCLELVSAPMASNLVDNVRQALEGFPIKQVFGWLDSTVVLHWIRGSSEFKQFVGNRTNCLWWKGPDWLATGENWPLEIVTSPSKESLAETKPV